MHYFCLQTVVFRQTDVTTHLNNDNLKLKIYISILTFALLGCSNPKRNLIVVENDSEIDLTKLDSVRENLNGFWMYNG